MADIQNPDSAQEQQERYDSFIFDSTGDRPPVIKEDYDIDNEMFLDEGTAISERTGRPIPRYLTKAFYKGPSLAFVAQEKAKRVFERRYPADDLRHMRSLYNEAARCFSTWWKHLDDDQSQKIDEEEIRQEYIREFIQHFSVWSELSDAEHPENLEKYHERMDKSYAYTKRFEDPDVGSRYSWRDYVDHNPRWKQNIAAQGREGGRQAAEEDLEIGVGFRKGKELEQLASERFDKLWSELVFEIYFEQQNMFDYVGLRTIYTVNFTRTYTERAAGGQGSVQTGGISARVVNTHLEGEARVYLMEINDPEHLDEPFLFEANIDTRGDPE